MNLKEKLNALKQVREKATQGEWEIHGISDYVLQTTEYKAIGCLGGHSNLVNDVRFIYTAANEWTSLIEALEVAVGELGGYKKLKTEGDDGLFFDVGSSAREALLKIDALLSKESK